MHSRPSLMGTLSMERRSWKLGASLHTKKKQACTNSPCLSSLLLLNIFCFNQQFCYFCSKESKPLNFFVAICFPNPCWTLVSAPWASTQSSYLSCFWSSLNKRFVFVSINKISPGLLVSPPSTLTCQAVQYIHTVSNFQQWQAISAVIIKLLQDSCFNSSNDLHHCDITLKFQKIWIQTTEVNRINRPCLKQEDLRFIYTAPSSGILQ